MKFPSLSAVMENFAATVRRFPIPVACSFFFAILGITLNHVGGPSMEESLAPFMVTAAFVFPIALALDIFAEEERWSIKNHSFLRLGVLAASILLYYLYFKDLFNWRTIEIVQFVITEGLAIVLLFALPFFYKDKNANKSFWGYFVNILQSFATAFVFFALLFLGVALLFASFDYLFEVWVPDEFYGDAWYIITFFLGVPFFLGHIQEKVRQLYKTVKSTKAMLMFSKYFLVPLVFFYVLLLYLYTGRIVLFWDWPKGGVAVWIIVFSLVGIFTYALSYYAEESYKSFLSHFKKVYFWALMPLVVVLFMAVGIRILDYGFTEVRYFGVVYGAWLAMISIYYALSKVKDLRFLVVSGAAVLLVAAWGGPFSAFNVSLNDQVGRLENLLETRTYESDLEDAHSVGSAIYYILNMHGPEHLDYLFETDLSADRPGNLTYSPWNLRDQLLGELGMEREYGGFYAGRYLKFLNFGGSYCELCIVDLNGYEKMVRFDMGYLNGETNNTISNVVWDLQFDAEKEMLFLIYDALPVAVIDMAKELEPFAIEGSSMDDIYLVDLVFEFSSFDVEGEVRFEDVGAYFSSDLKYSHASNIQGMILYNQL